MYYLNKNDQIFKISQLRRIYYFKNGSMTTMMPDTCTLNTSTKKNSFKVMNVIEAVQMLVDKKY